MRKLLTLAAVLGLIASQLLLSVTHATASSKPSRPIADAKPGHTLSLAQMLSTRGTDICNTITCNNTDSCNARTKTHWIPRTVCGWYWYPSTCNNFGNDVCSHDEYWTGLNCSGLDTNTGTDNKINYCGAG
jgi:hypothetical protein